jgi:hypothetical protein
MMMDELAQTVTPDRHLRGAQLKSWPGYQLPLQRFLVTFLSPFRQMWGHYSLLPHPYQFVNNSVPTILSYTE